MKAETFFTEEDRQGISTAIRDVERFTAGEVAVMVVDQSDSYPEARTLAGIVAGGLVALVITEYFFADSLWHFTPLALGLALVLTWLAGRLQVVPRLFIAEARLEEQVRKRALAAFYEKGLDKTRDASGVLFFISLFEHRVWVLADKGIHAKIKPEELEQYALVVAAAVKSGTAATVLCEQIRAVGAILAQHFPIKADDQNELPDEVIIG